MKMPQGIGSLMSDNSLGTSEKGSVPTLKKAGPWRCLMI